MKESRQPAALPVRLSLILVLISLLLASCDPQAGQPQLSIDTIPACIPLDQPSVEAQVVRIADGDTITVRIDGQDYRLRYIGINAPELDAEAQRRLAEQASDLNRQLVEDETLTLYPDTSDTDSYDRLLRYVVAGDIFINYELVRRGMARARDYPPDTACSATLEEAESLAREERLGIWAGQ